MRLDGIDAGRQTRNTSMLIASTMERLFACHGELARASQTWRYERAAPEDYPEEAFDDAFSALEKLVELFSGRTVAAELRHHANRPAPIGGPIPPT